MVRNPFKSFIKDKKGATSVEFGLVSMFFITMILGVFETGRLLYHWNTFQYAVEGATRYALIERNNERTVTTTKLTTFVSDEMDNLGVSMDDITLDTPTFTLGPNDMEFVEVVGTYTFNGIIPFLPSEWLTIPLSASSRQSIPVEP